MGVVAFMRLLEVVWVIFREFDGFPMGEDGSNGSRRILERFPGASSGTNNQTRFELVEILGFHLKMPHPWRPR